MKTAKLGIETPPKETAEQRARNVLAVLEIHLKNKLNKEAKQDL